MTKYMNKSFSVFMGCGDNYDKIFKKPKPEYTIEHFRNKYYICKRGDLIEPGYATREYAEKKLNEIA